VSFLQPAFLLALPVVLLPIIIHLVNQRRFQTVNWGAMQFLLAANRVSQGYARIRRWLILAARIAAIAALVFAISRPLSSGWLGLAGGGRVDTAIILIDRSPSMTMRDSSGRSKLDSSLDRIVRTLETLDPGRCVVIDSTNVQAIELDSPDQLRQLPQTSPSSKSADLPTMMEAVNQYVVANRPSGCDVWICSDVRQHDWNNESGRWDLVRQSLGELPQSIRFHLIAHTAPAKKNHTLRVTEARRIDRNDRSQLLLSLHISLSEPVNQPTTIPIQLELNGARSQLSAQISGSQLRLNNQVVPVDASQSRGWGRVSIAPDVLPADNEFFFVYDQPRTRKTVIVADDETVTEPFEFAASVSSDPSIDCTVQTVSPAQFVSVDLEDVALVIWHSAIPEDPDPSHPLLQSFTDRGRRLIFFPPSIPTDASFAGLKWSRWRKHSEASISNWVGDQDLLGRTLDGDALPVGELQISRSCGVDGDYVSLARIDQQSPILVRAMTDQRNVYFCTTSLSTEDSSLQQNGVVLYAMIHRALAAGIESLGATGMRIAGEVTKRDSQNWKQLAGDPTALSTQYAVQAGVYMVDERLVAINRSVGEDLATVLRDDQVASLFEGLDFHRVEVELNDGGSLVQEIWRICLVLMLAALVVESALCIPRSAGPAGSGRQHSENRSFA